jgi:hypothetical protein
VDTGCDSSDAGGGSEKIIVVGMVRWRAFGKGRKGTIGLNIEYVSLQQTITNHVGR